MQLLSIFSLFFFIASASTFPVSIRNLKEGFVQSFFDHFEAFSKVASWDFVPAEHHGAKAILVTCMDVRLMPEQALGLHAGQVHVLRVAGGRVRSLIPSIIVSQKLLGSSEITVLHHSECGMEAAARVIENKIMAKTEDQYKYLVDQLTFDSFPDLEQSLYDDYDILHNHPLVNSDNVRLGVWNVTTNHIQEVKRPASDH